MGKKMLRSDQRRPTDQDQDRTYRAYQIRVKAAQIARDRCHAQSSANDDEVDYQDTYLANFSKCLKHNAFGLVDKSAYEEAVRSLTTPDWTFPVTLAEGRMWESPLTGHYYDLEGPDADAVAMPPAPRLGSSELCAEIAEVYAMAILRDVPFERIVDGTGKKVRECLDALNKLPWFGGSGTLVSSFAAASAKGSGLTPQEERRRKARFGENEFEPDDHLSLSWLGARGEGWTLPLAIPPGR